MDNTTETKITKIIRDIELTDSCSSKIEEIACRFPEEYESEAEFVDFQQDIAEIVIQNNKLNQNEIQN